ncbi:MAG TPA: GFA family protein [Candidatus Sulfotelmatobacter sp.]|nr:GFA family protein [Candidatus Sulfotelmatobacter sp.]
MMETYEGGCHCGRVRFRVAVDLAVTEIGECNCSMCVKKGILHLAVPRERLEILSGADALTTYTFNTGTAKHTFCRHCGIHPFYHPRTDPENYSVNARCLDAYDPATMRPGRSFDGQHWEAAFARQSAARAGER